MGKFTSKLHDKKVLLLGGTSGVGFAVAEAVLEYGGIAILSSSQQSKIDSAIQRLSASYPEAVARIAGFPCDLSDSANLDTNLAALLTLAKNFTPVPSSGPPVPIDHIVYTAGNRVYPIPSVSSATLQTLATLTSVRYTAAVFLAKHAPSYMAPGPESSVTFTTNVSEHKPLKGWALSTGATSLNGLVAGLAVDLAPLRVNCVKLGFVETELLRAAALGGLNSGGGWKGEGGENGQADGALTRLKEERAKKTLTGRVVGPEDVAEAYLYFMKDSNVTGQSIITDGGYMLV